MRVAILAAVLAATPWPAWAQEPQPPDDDEDVLEMPVAEPDFHLITLPTQLKVPRHAFAFRLTHRFTRPLTEGSFGELAADFFGFDEGAEMGFGLRFGLFRATQLTAYRTSDRTIQLGVQQELLRQRRAPLGLSLEAGVEGQDNLSEEFSATLRLVASRRLGDRAAVYLVPGFVSNANVGAEPFDDADSTGVLGLGARVRLGSSSYVVAEFDPRLWGYRGNRGSGDREPLLAFALEHRVGGHVFQVNVQNALGTTPAQVARGQQGRDDWFLGFNLSRKFY